MPNYYYYFYSDTRNRFYWVIFKLEDKSLKHDKTKHEEIVGNVKENMKWVKKGTYFGKDT